MQKLIVLALVFVAVAYAAPQDVEVCVPSDSCPGQKIDGVTADYHCTCLDGFSGYLCDQADANSRAKFNLKPKPVTIKFDDDQVCATLTTQCVQGLPVVGQPVPQCA